MSDVSLPAHESSRARLTHRAAVFTAVVLAVSCALAAGLSGVARSAPVQARWVITDLGTLAGNGRTSSGSVPSSFASGINNRGQVVGGSATKNGPVHAFLWQNGRMSDLGVPPGHAWSMASAVNDKGTIVGLASISDGEDEVHAFQWQNGSVRDLGTLGGRQSWATAVNNRGQVVGFSKTKTGAMHGFLWQNGKIRDIGAFWPYAINDRGQVVGGTGGRFGGQAVLWENGTIRKLGPLGNFSSMASGINERGRIVGIVGDRASLWAASSLQRPWSPRTAKVRNLGRIAGGGHDYEKPAINEQAQIVGTIGNHAFVWERGVVQDLGTLSGRTVSYATAINDRGQIVGVSGSSTEANPYHAALWTQRG